MQSVWSDSITLPSFEPLEQDISTDVLIIGGGITGILCAYQLKKAGVSCILAEASSICSGITKNTTAKITSQHGLIYHKLIKTFGVEKAQLYLDANEFAVEQFCKLCQNIDCDFESKDSFVYSLSNIQKLEQELNALEKIGYSAEFTTELPLPFSTVGAIRFKNQAQFHPLKFLAQIATDLPIYENTKVTALQDGAALTPKGTISAKKIIVTTHFPFLNKHGSYFLKMYQHRSYVLALKNAPHMNGMYIDESGNGFSFRNYKDLLLLGGGSHRTGKSGGNWETLYKAANHYYPDAHEAFRWATQDCMTLDTVPYIGQYSKHTPNLYVATGFNKWGMTSSMVAASLLPDLVLEKDNPFTEVFSPSRTILHPQLAVNAFEALTNLLSFSTKRCPHMGCALKWNPQEHTWDCPCHGSRFTQNGTLIDNPAARDL